MKNIPKSITAHIDEVAEKLKKYPKLEKLYRNCYPNTLETTAEILPGDVAQRFHCTGYALSSVDKG